MKTIKSKKIYINKNNQKKMTIGSKFLFKISKSVLTENFILGD